MHPRSRSNQARNDRVRIRSMLGWAEAAAEVEVEEYDGEEGQNETERNVDVEERLSVLQLAKRYIGSDVQSLMSIPVWLMEPFTNLQKMAEIMEYSHLLDKASTCEDEFERMAWVAAFFVSPYAANERTYKPFNPILGETFEHYDANGLFYLAEQVSHHPPVAAAHAESKGSGWVYDIVSAPQSKFLGNSVEVYPYGRSRVRLENTGEVFWLRPPNSKAHNVLVGRTWVDSFGDMILKNTTTGSECVMTFAPCGWFGAGRYDLKGYISDGEGHKRLLLSGRWNRDVYCVLCDKEGEPLPDEEYKPLWIARPLPSDDAYGFTEFAHHLNAWDYVGEPLPSDSRRRSDREFLAQGLSAEAQSEKVRIEEKQRAERREREGNGDKWTPRWFEYDSDPQVYDGECDLDVVQPWIWNGSFEAEERSAHQGNGVESGGGAGVLGASFCPWQYNVD